LQIDVKSGNRWVEIGECGLVLPALLEENSLDPAHVSGLAMGLGLDRALMLRKGMGDIRLLRSSDPRVAGQLLDLSPYRPVLSQPAIRRDLSVAVEGDETAEELGDRVRAALGERAVRVENVEVLSETLYGDLPAAAVARLGISPGQSTCCCGSCCATWSAPSRTKKLTRCATRSTPPSTAERSGTGLQDPGGIASQSLQFFRRRQPRRVQYPAV
jgi:hypothetical protein